ncbi:hypothetical protein KY284_027816 [Solanum tuberosum]|uniref:ORF16-lacZ fusion protein n=1 Tax=Solanum tuberosum TaxID=4113 RepID=M0ZXY3_SOLTU|nr:hypothetical protein KY284_027816 [Solanum tuberosum]
MGFSFVFLVESYTRFAYSLSLQDTTASDILEEGGDDVKPAWPLWAGPHMCYNGNYNGKQGCKAERIRKDCLSSDCSLQLGNMKLESPVIADQHVAVNMYPGLVHTARHTLGIGFARSIGPMITHWLL